MLKEFKEFMLRSDLVTVAVGLAMAFATFYLVQAVVAYLIAPLISVFVGDPVFEVNAFRVDSSEFRYGAVIEAAITFVLVAAAVYFLLVVPYRRYQSRNGVAENTRACPECTSPISVVAKRCPYCTAVVQPELA
jgi:large conductance mechanosensitive channel